MRAITRITTVSGQHQVGRAWLLEIALAAAEGRAMSSWTASTVRSR
ncbi:MAG: hypothetical protein ACREQM_19705 [Candidatus Dormibacteraceae bacterium]